MQLPEQPLDLYEYQRIAFAEGYRLVAGIDEAGRGPLAGPVTAAAAVLPLEIELPDLNDSKQLSERQRERLFELLTSSPDVSWAIADIPPRRIDEVNILNATHECMRLAAAELTNAPELIFVDGNPVQGFGCPAVNIVKGDAKCAAISAASILAKVHRDRLMVSYDAEYPGYGFAKHKGYGTAEHLAAINELGPCPIHRMTFAPVAKVVNESKQGELDLL